MAIKFQYNKTALQKLNQQLRIRLRALPTLKNKEAALRIEVKKAKNMSRQLENKIIEMIDSNDESLGLWNEYNRDLVAIKSVKALPKKIAGVKIYEVENIIFNEIQYSVFDKPKWFAEGICFVKNLAKLVTQNEFFKRKIKLLEHARRKTTQKVNLYEKVQIPGYEDAIRKIRRFIEDEENLSKSAQKIVKKRKANQKEEAQ